MVNLPFLKKKNQQVTPSRGSVPSDRVREMASRGFSEPEMIDVLRREGYSPEEIDRALTTSLQLNITGEAGLVGQQAPQQAQNQLSQPANPNIMPNFTPSSQPIQTLQQEPQKESVLPQIPETSLPEDYYSSYSAEDYIDYALQTRMSEINEKFDDLEERQKKISEKIDEFGKKIESLSQKKTNEPNESSQKAGQFSDAVMDIDSRVGALEKAFKETLPALIESVRTLSDLIQKMKKEE